MAKMMSIAELRREIARRESAVKKLEAQRAALAKRLEKIDRQIAQLAGGAAPAPAPAPAAQTKATGARKRVMPKKGADLKSVLVKAMTGGAVMSIGEAMAAVQKAGYKSSSKNFRLILSQTLSKDDRFKTVTRGKYTLAG